MNFWDNDQTWTSQDGTVHRIDELPRGHAVNILNWIRARVKRIKDQDEWYWAIQVGMHDGGDMAHDALEAEMDAVLAMSDQEFYDQLPVVRALKRQVADHSLPLEWQIVGNSKTAHLIKMDETPTKKSGRRSLCGKYPNRSYDAMFSLWHKYTNVLRAIEYYDAKPCERCQEEHEKLLDSMLTGVS